MEILLLSSDNSFGRCLKDAGDAAAGILLRILPSCPYVCTTRSSGGLGGITFGIAHPLSSLYESTVRLGLTSIGCDSAAGFFWLSGPWNVRLLVNPSSIGAGRRNSSPVTSCSVMVISGVDVPSGLKRAGEAMMWYCCQRLVKVEFGVPRVKCRATPRSGLWKSVHSRQEPWCLGGVTGSNRT